MQSVLQFRLLIFFLGVCVFLICRGLNAHIGNAGRPAANSPSGAALTQGRP
jgi:hypothetical protein